MSYLLAQIFLLMLGAFLLGATLACFVRTAFFSAGAEERADEPGAWKSRDAPERRPVPAPISPAADRFSRALTGKGVDLAPEPAPMPAVAVVRTKETGASQSAMAAAVAAAKDALAASATAAPPAAAAPVPQPAALQPEPPKATPQAASPQPAPTPFAAAPEPKPTRTAPPAAEPPAAPPRALTTPPSSQDAAPPQSAGAHDDLTRIRGVDAALAAKLLRLGVTRFDQIARWRADDVARANAEFGAPGRVEQQNWVEQAAVLARGGETRFARERAPAPSGGASAIQAASSSAAPSVKPATAFPPGSRAGNGDDLKRIRGVGVLIEKRLNALAVTSYDQIANWTGTDIDRVSQALDIKGKIERENWVEQARILASGGQTMFSRRA